MNAMKFFSGLRSRSKQSLWGKEETISKDTSCDLKKEEGAKRTPNEKITQAFIDLLNAHETAASLFHPRADILFPDASMTLVDYMDDHKSLVASFPDFRIDCTVPPKEQEDGSVVILGAIARGTHTGTPYAFGPFPAIESKGVRVQNDPEIFTIIIEDGLITKLKVEPKGDISGPPGFYTQIGGIIF